MSDLYLEMRQPASRGGKMRVDTILEAMDDDDRESLLAALADPDVQTQRIAMVLTDRGWAVSWSAVKNWRRKQV